MSERRNSEPTTADDMFRLIGENNRLMADLLRVKAEVEERDKDVVILQTEYKRLDEQLAAATAHHETAPPAEVEAALSAWWTRYPEMPRPLPSERADLLATVATLVALNVEAMEARIEAAEQRSEMAEARAAALRKYVDHLESCDIYPVPAGCTCGLVALLATRLTPTEGG